MAGRAVQTSELLSYRVSFPEPNEPLCKMMRTLSSTLQEGCCLHKWPVNDLLRMYPICTKIPRLRI